MGPNFAANAAYVDRLRAFARERGWSVPTLAIAWTLHRGDHLIPIPGTRTIRHLEQDAAAADIRLTAEDMAAIERILPVGFAHGPRYSEGQAIGPESYC
jgi:aryl-alcohol dehydrogenase-like predicted oxidoreductase